jgi:ClpP class serine protease
MLQIWACEQEFIKGYIERVINASPGDVQAANSIFSGMEQPEILAVDGTEAAISIRGLLSQNGPSPVDRFFGFDGTSYAAIIQAIDEIRADRNIETVKLLLDTPGGEIKGVDQVWSAVFNLAQEKTVISVNLGLLASAGYWISSPSDRIVADSPTALTGSVGVVITYVDTSKLEERAGIKFVQVVSKNAPAKRPDLNTKEGLKVVQDRADSLERIFITRIAQGRGVTEDKVIKDFGRGDVLLAADPDPEKPTAVSRGLIDAVEATGPALSGAVPEAAMAALQEGETLAGATPFRDLKIVDRPWDKTAADRRLRSATGSTEKPSRSYRGGFFWFDSADWENFGAYKLPFVDVVDGEQVAIRRAVFAADAAMGGARGGVKIPQGDRAAVQRHIDRYKAKIEKQDKEQGGALHPVDQGITEKERKKMDDLIKLMAENPVIKTQHEELVEKAITDAVAASTAKLQGLEERVKACVPYLVDSSYPVSVQKLAVDVLQGTQEKAALIGAVTVIDAQREQENHEKAKADTEEPGETPAQQQDAARTDGEIHSDHDYEAQVLRFRKIRGH